MIQLSNLSLNNFLSHVDTHLDLSKYKGLVLVEGNSHDGHYSSNGSGKSTLLEGIVYALTGDTLRGVSVNDVVNRNIKKNTCSSLEFIRDSEEYKVSRYRKDDNYGDSIILYKGEENISKRVNKDTQKSLEDVLGISYKVLVSTILLGEGLSSRFTQLSDPEKKSLIESTLNMNYDMNKIREKANSSMKSLTMEVSTLNGEISTLESILDIDKEFIESRIKDNLELVDIYVSTSQYLKEQYDKISSITESIHPKLSLLNEALSKYTILDREFQNLLGQYNMLVAEREKVQNASIPVCTLCHQHLSSPESVKSVLDSHDKNISDIVEKMKTLKKELDSLPDPSILREKISSLNEEYTKQTIDAQSIMKDYNDAQIKIAEARKDIEVDKNTLSLANDSNDKLIKKKERRDIINSQISRYEYFYNLFSPTGIIVNILSDAIEYINDRLSTYSDVLLEKDYRINFVKGKISLIDSKGSNYQSLSNGEKRRLDIAIQFSLHDYVCAYCGNTVDTMFIDEILDTLDDVGIENIITVLRLKLDYCKLSRILVISHNSALKSYFDNVITVSKDASGNSKIS